MKITMIKIIRELKKHGWNNIDATQLLLIIDVMKIINTELFKHKNITIKK